MRRIGAVALTPAERQRRYVAAHPERAAEIVARSREKNRAKRKESDRARRIAAPQKAVAREALNDAIRRGKMVRRPCAVCANPRSQAHHYLGYAPRHRLDVVWLCAPHHWVAHRVLQEAAA